MTRWIKSRMGGVLVALVCWVVPAAAQSPDPNNSFYVPQAGLDYGNPLEGDEAIPYFRACPNNDEGASLPFAARIKIVVKDSNGAPIPGIPASNLCILFNGGTLAQGFSGLGADSVIANLLFNPVANCPDVRCVPADAPTDANGVAYITFTGPGGVRDPNRKWGHYDSDFPVYASGVRISGRLTSDSANGSYVLRIKNFDHVGGLLDILNQGETVTAGDLNGIISSLGVHNALSYWRDFDSDGEVGVSDFNMAMWHFAHDCDSPNNP
jgi:hypothetical protein